MSIPQVVDVGWVEAQSPTSLGLGWVSLWSTQPTFVLNPSVLLINGVQRLINQYQKLINEVKKLINGVQKLINEYQKLINGVQKLINEYQRLINGVPRTNSTGIRLDYFTSPANSTANLPKSTIK